MSLIDTPKPPAPPKHARQVTSLTEEDRETAPLVPARTPKTRRKPSKQGESEALRARLTEALLQGPATAAQLAERTGDHIVNVYTALRELRTAHGAHIARVGLPIYYGVGPSPAGHEPDIAHLPGNVGRAVLVLLMGGAHTSRAISSQIVGKKPWQAIKDLLNRGFVARDGAPGQYVYRLTDAGRKLADYIAKLEEAFPCS